MRVAIIGGGPAGSRAGELLARQGARVTLFEAQPGSEKPCGGGVPERTLDHCPFLADQGPQRLAAKARLFSPSNREAIVPLGEPLRIFSRCDLNRLLLDRAVGAGTGLVARRVTGVEASNGAWRIRHAGGESCGFDFLIGADGASGLVRGRIPGLRALRQSVGIGYFLDGLTSDEIILKFFPRLDGYLWVFPRIDHLAAGICGPTGAGQGEHLLARLEEFLTDLYGAAVLRRRRRYGARIPFGLPGAGPVAGSAPADWALVGDAAGLVDPLTREGIHYALASAELLVGTIREERREAYPDRLAERLASEMDWAESHRGLFFSTPFIEAFTLLADASPAVQAIVSDLVSGRQSYRRLRRRLAANGLGAAGSLLARLLRPGGRLPPPPLCPVAESN